jgi:hypothetical protein
MVNTIYQERMISFVAKFSAEDAEITSDIITRWQLRGFTSGAFYSKHFMYYEHALDPASITNERWSLFLLHYDGRAGLISEPVEYRTKEVLDNIRNTLGNIIYDNGESFIISR